MAKEKPISYYGVLAMICAYNITTLVGEMVFKYYFPELFS